jgi:hypothetical protein
MRTFAIAAALFFGTTALNTHRSAGTTALQAQRSREVLPSVKSLNCTFPLLATGTWKNGEAHAEVKSTPLSLRFENINTDEGTARVIGNFGPSDIIVRLSLGTLHLVQIFNEGALYATTVFPKETRAGKLQALHTRHEYTEIVAGIHLEAGAILR